MRESVGIDSHAEPEDQVVRRLAVVRLEHLVPLFTEQFGEVLTQDRFVFNDEDALHGTTDSSGWAQNALADGMESGFVHAA